MRGKRRAGKSSQLLPPFFIAARPARDDIPESWRPNESETETNGELVPVTSRSQCFAQSFPQSTCGLSSRANRLAHSKCIQEVRGKSAGESRAHLWPIIKQIIKLHESGVLGRFNGNFVCSCAPLETLELEPPANLRAFLYARPTFARCRPQARNGDD